HIEVHCRRGNAMNSSISTVRYNRKYHIGKQQHRINPPENNVMSQMSESELKSILAAEIADSLAHLGGELSEQRRKALRYYLGEPFGNEQEGRSKVVSTDVADVVEWILPSLLKIFT